jgi:ectoine hydroxylase-related dioxygenase (phytanoyl-CoA dioxygenase family)
MQDFGAYGQGVKECADLSELKRSYLENGYAIAKNVFQPQALSAVAGTMRTILDKGRPRSESSIDEMILERESENHALVYNSANSVGSSASTYQLLGGSPILDIVADFWSVKVTDLHLMPMYLLVQLPSDGRFDYAWHQDGAYYDWCHELATLWFPLTREASVENGTIGCVGGSHLQGLRPAETYKRHGFFRQIEAEVTEDETVTEDPLYVGVGDCCIMHGHTVHRSMPNQSSVPRVTGIVRLVNIGREDSYARDQFYCIHKP